ncbi:MAG: hypothetical protein R3Y08_01645 [Rikenellaceae bacterium]
MKRILTTFALLVVGCLTASSQSIPGITGSYGYNTGLISLNADNTLSSNEMSLSFGYRFSRSFVLRTRTEISIGLFDDAGDKDYARSGTLGLEAGYNIVSQRDCAFEVAYALGNTIGMPYWSYMYQDFGAKYYIGGYKSKIYFGAGVRYYSTQNENFGNLMNGYLSIGFTIN